MSRYEKASCNKSWKYSHAGSERVKLLPTIKRHKILVKGGPRDSKSKEKSKCIAITNWKNRMGLLNPVCTVERMLPRVAQVRAFELEFEKSGRPFQSRCEFQDGVDNWRTTQWMYFDYLSSLTHLDRQEKTSKENKESDTWRKVCSYSFVFLGPRIYWPFSRCNNFVLTLATCV